MNRILVIEDDDALRGNIVDLLTAEGYYPLQARDGEEGARLAWDWHPDLIICDILLPRLDGYGVLAKLSRDSSTATIPFLFLTALTAPEQLRKGMSLGADDYMTKPFDLNELLRVIRIRLDKNRTLALKAQRVSAEWFSNLSERLPGEALVSLNQILRASQLLVEQADILEREKIKDQAGKMNRAAASVIHLMQNYLFLMELEDILGDSGRVLEHQRTETTKAHELVNEIALAAAHQSARQRDLLMELGEANLRIASDHLLKIVEEILASAFIITAPGSVIQISGKALPDRGVYRLIFGNSGWDVELEALQQLGGSTLMLNEGPDQLRISLGLHIVRRLVDLYRGEVHLMSRAGGGAQIVLAIPLANRFRQ